MPNNNIANFCQNNNQVVNPLFESWVIDGFGGLCISQQDHDELLTYSHPQWGADCILGTPDDDNNDVGNDECQAGYQWEVNICACVGFGSECLNN